MNMLHKIKIPRAHCGYMMEVPYARALVFAIFGKGVDLSSLKPIEINQEFSVWELEADGQMPEALPRLEIIRETSDNGLSSRVYIGCV